MEAVEEGSPCFEQGVGGPGETPFTQGRLQTRPSPTGTRGFYPRPGVLGRRVEPRLRRSVFGGHIGREEARSQTEIDTVLLHSELGLPRRTRS